jgi:hypothetical protein
MRSRRASRPTPRRASLGRGGFGVTATGFVRSFVGWEPADSALAGAPDGGVAHGLAVAGGKLYWLVFDAGQLALHRSDLDGKEARVLGRVQAKSGAYRGSPIGPPQLTVDGGFVYFNDPGTVSTISPSNETLEGVTGAPDGVIYRLPE